MTGVEGGMVPRWAGLFEFNSWRSLNRSARCCVLLGLRMACRTRWAAGQKAIAILKVRADETGALVRC